MENGKILAVIILDYIFLYTGCNFDNRLLKLTGTVCLLALAIATVLPGKKT